MNIKRLVVRLYEYDEARPDLTGYRLYADVDLRSGVNQVELIEADSADGAIQLPPGYVIESVFTEDDDKVIIHGAIWNPEKRSLEALGKKPLVEKLREHIFVKQVDDRFLVELAEDSHLDQSGDNLVLMDCGHQAAADQNREEIIRMLAKVLEGR